MNRKKKVLWIGASALLLVALGGFFWFRAVRHRLPHGFVKDVRAGLAAREIKDPDDRLLKYLEGRYGRLSDPANRERVFVDFFDVEHIKVLQMIATHAPEAQRQANIDAMARWVAAYRESLSEQERASLKARFQTPEGRSMLRRATAQYNTQDVRYRGNTAPVFSQLLRTLNEVEQTN